MREIIVDFPAFGKPKRPTSASSFKCSRRSFSSPGKPRLELARRAVGRRGKRRVAVAAEAPLGDEHALPLFGQVRHQHVLPVCLPLVHGRADRHLELDVLPVLPGAIRALTVPAAAGREDFLEAVIEERVEVGVGDEVDRSAGTAVAAARVRRAGRTSRGGMPWRPGRRGRLRREYRLRLQTRQRCRGVLPFERKDADDAAGAP